MAAKPEYTTPINGTKPAVLSAANTARDGTGVVDILTAGANGAIIEKLIVQATGPTSAGVVRFFVSDNAGANYRLIDEIAVTVVTLATSTDKVFRESKTLDVPYPLESGQKIGATTHVANSFVAWTVGGNL